MKMDAEYKCNDCSHEWTGYRGEQQARHGIDPSCPKCKSVYYTWTNYKSTDPGQQELKV